MNTNTDDLYARRAERYFDLHRVDEDELTSRLFGDLSPVEQTLTVVKYVKQFGLQHLSDALSDISEESLLQAYELGDGAMGSMVRRAITQALEPAIDRSVSRGEFELEGA